MSGHVHPESGEKSNEKKTENVQHNPVQVPILTRITGIQPQLVQHGEVPKSAMPVRIKG